MIKNIREVKKCPNCFSENIVYNDKDDQVICKDCAEIFEPLTPDEEEEFEKSHHM